MIETYNGIEYKRPEVVLLKDSGIGVAELAARTCYDSFDNSENDEIKRFNEIIGQEPDELVLNNNIRNINNIDSSELLDSLAWVHHHHSIIEHATLSFFIKSTSRGVLQEHARHRIQSISVRSTRYTMSDVIYAYLAVSSTIENIQDRFKKFNEILLSLNMFVTTTPEYLTIETNTIMHKLDLQRTILGDDEFLKISLAKDNLAYINKINPEFNCDEVYKTLQDGKKKRNVGDSFKHIVTDNWVVDMVVTFNLRSLKNYLDLRGSGAAFFQINWLAEEMIKTIPNKYLKLISKKHRDKN